MTEPMQHGGSDQTTAYRLDLSYEGTPFCGWARQPGGRSIEGELETALATVLRERVRLSVAGRTDAGVHALAQVVSFHSAQPSLDARRVRLSLNALLPPEIAVTTVSPAPPGFEARAASARTYRYRLWLPDGRPVVERQWVWDVRGPVDTGLLAAAAPLLVGKRDFAALTPSARSYHTCVREVRQSKWEIAEDGREAVFHITAGSFLHNMVRVAVGSMVDVAQERLSLDQFADALASGERTRMGRTAPPQGLALVDVEYAGVSRPATEDRG
jgi:tRNA pseudouridine38-40 synthase